MQAQPILHLIFEQAIAPKDLSLFSTTLLSQWSDAGELPSLRRDRSAGYPNIQFKVRHYFGHCRPMLFAMGMEAQFLFDALQAGYTTLPAAIADMRLLQLRLGTRKHFFDYQLFNYKALNATYAKQYALLTNQPSQVAFLHSCLQQHLGSLLEGLGMVPSGILLRDIRLRRRKCIRWKGRSEYGFDLQFTTNVFLPEYIGVGRDVRCGFGVVRRGEDGRDGGRRTGGELRGFRV
ncbi:MAG: CRISPR-associated endonuclease Cas6 [Bacteroidota bacterium]